MCHIAALIGTVPPAVREHLDSEAFHAKCMEGFKRLDRDCTGSLEGRELID